MEDFQLSVMQSRLLLNYFNEGQVESNFLELRCGKKIFSDAKPTPCFQKLAATYFCSISEVGNGGPVCLKEPGDE